MSINSPFLTEFRAKLANSSEEFYASRGLAKEVGSVNKCDKLNPFLQIKNKKNPKVQIFEDFDDNILPGSWINYHSKSQIRFTYNCHENFS